MCTCHVCWEPGAFVCRDSLRNYFRCSGKEIWHEWSELRNPVCENCGDGLLDHVRADDADGYAVALCRSAAGTYESPEDTR